LWFRTWAAGRAWLAPASDYTIVSLLCEAQDDYALVRDLLNSGAEPRYYVTANGQVVTHPLVVQLQNLRAQMTAWLSAIGFSPSDRSRLGLAEVRVRDDLDELAQRRVRHTATA
jgi:P27 family predicted phage terminase small subunit